MIKRTWSLKSFTLKMPRTLIRSMRRLFSIALLAIFLASFILYPVKEAKALSSKAKVVAITAGYGAGAGTLLGVASLAFGTKSRAIFIGASLGLYAGILVGAYLLLFPPAHLGPKEMRPEDQYPNERYSLYRNDYGESDQSFNLGMTSAQAKAVYMPMYQFNF